MTSEELRARLRADFLAMMAAKPPEERARLLSRLPRYQRDGLTKMIEDHNRQTNPTGD